MKKYDRLIKESLVKYNILSEPEAQQYLAEAQAASVSFKEYLLQNAEITEKQILICLSQILHTDTIDLSAVEIEKSLIEKVPIKFVWYYKFLPIKVAGNVLTIAIADPMDVKTQDEIRMHLGFQIQVCLTTESSLLEGIKKHYGFASETIDRIITREPGRVGSSSSSGEQQAVEDLELQSEDPTVSNLVNQIILEAYKKRATDIHIEPYRNKVRLRYRIDGKLVDGNLPEQVKHFLPAILSRIKIMANLSITERRLPQDGSAVVKTKEQQLDLRVSTMPTPSGESLVIRILPSKVMFLSLEKLGFNKQSVDKFRHLIRQPHGIVFLTGPTGSGKTTTLYACLKEINSFEKKIITIEDPVEYEMEGVTQVQVNPRVNFTFATGLRSMLRHDPDIIMVGEVRDLETAEIAIRTALTGHLVFSTLHTNDSASGITRLIDMGVEPYLVASSVEAFVAQRLIRLNCPKCKEEDPDPVSGIKEEVAHSLGLPSTEDIKFYRGKGCDHCNQTGYHGRMAIYEILILDDAIRTAILTKPRSDYIKSIAVKQGLVTLRQNGWRAVLDGLTTPDEVLNVTVKDKDPLANFSDEQPSQAGLTKAENREEKDKFVRIKKRGEWQAKNNYDSRIYDRTFDPVQIRYRLAKRDPHDPETLLSDGVEYTATTKDLSAGGLRFVSKVLLSIGTILDLRIQLPDHPQAISCLAKVCRVEEDSLSNVYTIVSYYLDITSSDRTVIDKFVEQSVKREEAPDPAKITPKS